MRFIHCADIHIGAWRDQRMSQLPLKAFTQLVDDALSLKVDFILLAGDFFNTALPSIDLLKSTIIQLIRLKNAQIPVYCIPGSHDYSPSGKTMLDILEQTNLLTNVFKGTIRDEELHLAFTQDPKTGAKLTGMPGRKGVLEKKLYTKLARTNLEQEVGFKIFLFHTALDELKPEHLDLMDAAPISLLPQGFEYYAGGHVHVVNQKTFSQYKNVLYPGPLFPTTFSELERLSVGGYYFYDEGTITYEPIVVKKHQHFVIDVTNKSPVQINEEIIRIANNPIDQTIITVRFTGELENSTLADINLQSARSFIEQKAFCVLFSLNEVMVKKKEMKKEIIKVTAEQEEIMRALDCERKEGETVHDFEKRLLERVFATLQIK
ncbi:DNA repair exonuclease [Candidatus Woesearchaeota archaeon]|nr:MAG: DNA repair exonuclease [Candidatus Woesearchaeota archaeon]